jgi:hypothetical protein
MNGQSIVKSTLIGGTVGIALLLGIAISSHHILQSHEYQGLVIEDMP